MKYNKLIFFLLCATLLIYSCTSLPEGLATKTEVYNADNVDFYYDLNYETADGERKVILFMEHLTILHTKNLKKLE